MPGRTIDGEWYPSVTEVIPQALRPDFSCVPPEVLQIARERGTALHAAIDSHERNDSAPAPKSSSTVLPGFDAYQQFKKETGFRYEAGEFEVRSRIWRYVGHPDLLGWIGAERVMIDIKYVAAFGAAYREYTALQTIGGYGPAWLEGHPHAPIFKFYALWLRMDGTFRLVPLEKRNAEMVFRACLVIAHEARKLKKKNRNDGGNK